jgi:hypothetical protein
MDIELPDISNFRDVSDLSYIFFGTLTIDVIVLFLTRYYNVGGKYLNEWYDQFNVLAVLADVMIIVIGFIITRYLYTAFFYDKFGWNPMYFILLLVVVQIVHDILFYAGVIRNIPMGHNEMMDVFKKYAEDLGGNVIMGDALLVIFSALVAMLYKLAPLHVFVSVNSLFVYALPYILFTRNPYNIVPEQEKKDEKAKLPEKIDAYNRMK